MNLAVPAVPRGPQFNSPQGRLPSRGSQNYISQRRLLLRYVGVLLRLVVAFMLSLAVAGIASGQTTNLLLEMFDGVTAPDLPASVTADNTTWKTSISSESPGSGGNNIVHTGTTPGSILLGPIDLSGRASATLSYYARRTSSYPADSLLVRFSIDGGSTFPHVVSTGGLPAAASAYEYVELTLGAPLLGETDVYLQFDGRGGTGGSANMRLDDIRVAAPSNPGDVVTSFGFATSESTWTPSSGDHTLALEISFPGTDSLQGLQFDLQASASFLTIGAVALTQPFQSDPLWQLTQNNERTVLINTASNPLPPGDYPSLLTIPVQFTGSPLLQDSTVTLSLTNFIASSANASGDEMTFVEGSRTHQLTILASLASISVSVDSLPADSLRFGSVAVGDSTSLTLSISNPTGQTDLLVDSLRFDIATPAGIEPINITPTTSAHPPSVFYLAPADATSLLSTPIPPGTTLDVPIWFKPSLSTYGHVFGSVQLFHNAPSDSTVVGLLGQGLGGRGDTDLDGELDVADVIWALDVVSGLITLSPTQFAPYDLHPFPTGDGLVDVRDLTVQIQAILRGEWPDSSPLPSITPSGSPAPPGSAAPPGLNLAGKAGNSGNRFEIAGSSLYIDVIEPIRGIQLTLNTPQQPQNIIAAKQGASSYAAFDSENNTFTNIVTFQPDHMLGAGQHVLFNQLPIGTTFSEGILLTGAKQKHRIYQLDGISTISEEIPPSNLEPMNIYPTPYSLSRHNHLNLLAGSTEPNSIEIFDLLGRETMRVAFNPVAVFGIPPVPGSSSRPIIIQKHQLPKVPGLHFIRITSKTGVTTLPLTILH